MWVQSLGRKDPLEKEMATHPSVLAWKTPWTGEIGRLQSTRSQRAGHDLAIEHVRDHFLFALWFLHLFFSFECLLLSSLFLWKSYVFLLILVSLTFFFSVAPCSLWDLSSLTTDWTLGPQQWDRGVLTTWPPGNSLVTMTFKFFRSILWVYGMSCTLYCNSKKVLCDC